MTATPPVRIDASSILICRPTQPGAITSEEEKVRMLAPGSLFRWIERPRPLAPRRANRWPHSHFKELGIEIGFVIKQLHYRGFHKLMLSDGAFEPVELAVGVFFGWW